VAVLPVVDALPVAVTRPVTALVLGCLLLGLVVGSFLNVVVWRVPRGESVVTPASHCPGCDMPVRPADNVPVLSWLRLRGRCRDCDTPISVRYPLVEVLTAVVFAALALRFGLDPALPAYLYLGAVGIALTLIDLDTRRLPRVLTRPSYAVGLVLLGVAALAGDGQAPYLRALLGCLALYAFYFLLRRVAPRGMGGGDVTLSGLLGLYLGYLGWDVLVVGGFLGFLLGGVLSALLLASGRAGRKTAIPFGPFMLLGALVAVLAGEQLAEAYLTLTLG